MSKVFLSLLLPVVWSFMVHGQISIVSGDLPVIGDTLPSAKDTLMLDGTPSTDFNATAGANQSWNFNTATPHQLIPTYAVAPNTTPEGGSFPNATIAYTVDFSGYSYNKLTPTVYTAEGFSGELFFGITSVVEYNPTYDQYRFSVDYQDSYSDDYAFTETTDYDDLPPELQTLIDDAIDASGAGGLVDEVTQLRLRFSSNFTHTVDAWGTVTTPLGTYDCLRQKREETSSINIDIEYRTIFGNTDWIDDAFVVPLNSTNYEWLTKVTKLPVVTLDVDTGGIITAVNYSLTPPVPSAGFTFVEGSAGSVMFTNTSENSPTAYSWDFGDGNSSAAEDPTHVYAANGTYYVCLTVTNSTGNDVFCDSVSVTTHAQANNPPNAVDDTIDIDHGSVFVVSPLTNDSDPDGDNISLNSFSAPALGSTSSSGATKIQYESPYGYCGLDSFTYVICDDGSPVLCDTATVLVYVDSCVTHSIALNSGWSLISTFVVPTDLDIANIFSPIVSNVLIVKNGVGDAYIPSFGINAIGDWEIEEGYKVKTDNAAVLDISGPVVDPSATPISLSIGWSQIAYLRTSPMDATTVFNEISSNVVLVKNITGDSYIPSFGINAIGDMQPGQGYKVKMSGAATLDYPDN